MGLKNLQLFLNTILYQMNLGYVAKNIVDLILG